MAGVSRKTGVLGGVLLLALGHSLFPQEKSLEELLSAFKGQALVLNIVTRVVQEGQEEPWNSVNSQITIPGRAVGLKLVGANIVVTVQFTPYFGKDGSFVLVAQGQIWIDLPGQGTNYQTTMQTIPLKFGESVYFFPLGSEHEKDEPQIEIQLALSPYTDE